MRTFSQGISSLERLGVQDLGQIILFQLLYQKLGNSNRLDFERRNSDMRQLKTCNDLLEFLQNQIIILELEKIASGNPTAVSHVEPSRKAKVLCSFLRIDPLLRLGKKVVHCAMNHTLCTYMCAKFHALSIDDRHSLVREKSLCYSCFGQHARIDCKSKNCCKTCNSAKHNTSLSLDFSKQRRLP